MKNRSRLSLLRFFYRLSRSVLYSLDIYKLRSVIKNVFCKRDSFIRIEYSMLLEVKVVSSYNIKENLVKNKNKVDIMDGLKRS